MDKCEILELLEILISGDLTILIDNEASDEIFTMGMNNHLLEYILNASNAEQVINRQLNEVRNWLAAEFENEEVLDYGDEINRLIIERGIEGYAIKSIYIKDRRLTIDFGDFKSVSVWKNATVPNQLIENNKESVKANLMQTISDIDDLGIIRKLTKKLEKLINE